MVPVQDQEDNPFGGKPEKMGDGLELRRGSLLECDPLVSDLPE